MEVEGEGRRFILAGCELIRREGEESFMSYAIIVPFPSTLGTSALGGPLATS